MHLKLECDTQPTLKMKNTNLVYKNMFNDSSHPLELIQDRRFKYKPHELSI